MFPEATLILRTQEIMLATKTPEVTQAYMTPVEKYYWTRRLMGHQNPSLLRTEDYRRNRNQGKIYKIHPSKKRLTQKSRYKPIITSKPDD